MGVALAALLLVASMPVEGQGRLVQFKIERFDDTLFASVDAVYRVEFDDRGHLWYTTQAGVVHVDPANHTRELYTRIDGLPSSFGLGLDVRGSKVYAGTDLGLAVIDMHTGKVEAHTPLNSPLPDYIVQDVAVDGDEVWIGTYFGGVIRLNAETGAWSGAKNTSTTADYPKAVRRIVPAQDAVWVATDGDGLWRYDRATGAWSVLLKDDGLVTNDVRSVLYAGDALYVGTEKGLQVRRDFAPYKGTADAWVLFNTTNSGLPDNLILDLDVIPVEGGGVDLFASTRKGIWQYDGDTGNYTILDQGDGILGSSIVDNTFSRHGWAIASTRGVSLQRGSGWSYYVTGPSDPTLPSQGPANFMFTSASVGESGPFLFFGMPNGISAYRPASGDSLGVWWNFAEWSNYTGGPVNWIDTEADITWVASNSGVYGYKHSTDPEKRGWFERKVLNSRNLVYGLEADRGELWIALFGDGLIMRNLTTGQTRSWDAHTTPTLPDLFLTDVRAQGNDIWLGSSVGVIRMDRSAGTVTATYTVADGMPGAGIVYRVLPEGRLVWVATKDAGVALLDANLGTVTSVWNATVKPGFPDGEVRSMHREGNYLFVGTTDGLARIHVGTGDFKVYRTTDSALVQNYVNGITSRDGILYLATLSGIARLDVASDRFLPMQEGPDVRPRRDDAPFAPQAPSVRVTIASPRHLDLVSGLVRVAGTAQASGGGAVDRVDVQLGDGAWMRADGTTSWSHVLDVSALEPDRTVTLRARAYAGNDASRVAEVLVIPVQAPQTPLQVEAIVPPNATAGRDLTLAARATGDPPLIVSAYYQMAGATTSSRVEMTQDGSIWRATIPGARVTEGEVRFYIEARSGAHARTDPPDPGAPYVLQVAAAPRLEVELEAPTSVEAVAGEPKTIPLVLRNTGNTPVSVKLELQVQGPAARWLKLPDETYDLDPGAVRHVDAAAEVEAAAVAQTRRVVVAAVDVTGVADPSTAAFDLKVTPSSASPKPTPRSVEERGTPGAPAALAALAAAFVALSLRRKGGA